MEVVSITPNNWFGVTEPLLRPLEGGSATPNGQNVGNRATPNRPQGVAETTFMAVC